MQSAIYKMKSLGAGGGGGGGGGFENYKSMGESQKGGILEQKRKYLNSIRVFSSFNIILLLK